MGVRQTLGRNKPACPKAFALRNLLPHQPTTGQTMTREEAFARCTPDSYVEFYGGRWLIVPIAQVEQPPFFVCTPRGPAVTKAGR
jgi:hypothetical protein